MHVGKEQDSECEEEDLEEQEDELDVEEEEEDVDEEVDVDEEEEGAEYVFIVISLPCTQCSIVYPSRTPSKAG